MKILSSCLYFLRRQPRWRLGLALNQFFSSIPLYRAMGDIVWNARAIADKTERR